MAVEKRRWRRKLIAVFGVIKVKSEMHAMSAVFLWARGARYTRER